MDLWVWLTWISSGANFSKYLDGWLSSCATAVINTCLLARVNATFNNLFSSSANPAAEMASSCSALLMPCRKISTNRSEPSNDPRCFKLGQLPSCIPASATYCHSKPLAECTVITCTTSPRCAVAVMLSERIFSPRSWSIKREGLAPGRRSLKRLATSNKVITASRFWSAIPPRTPPASAVCCQICEITSPS